MNLLELQKPLIALAKTAGQAILEIYQQSEQYTVCTKADHSPLTQADLLAHKIISNGLQTLTADLPILSEEGLAIPWEQRQTWTTYWLIDPLDGTRQFIQHNGEFTVNIALIHQHMPIIGVLYVPVAQETYYACADWGGAYKLDAENLSKPLQTRPWSPHKTTLLTSRAAAKQPIMGMFGHLGQYAQIKMSSAWKFGWVAEGKADISPRLGDTCEWDTAAGQCILELAGGALVDLHGRPLRYNTRSSLINPHFMALGDPISLASRLFG